MMSDVCCSPYIDCKISDNYFMYVGNWYYFTGQQLHIFLDNTIWRGKRAVDGHLKAKEVVTPGFCPSPRV